MKFPWQRPAAQEPKEESKPPELPRLLRIEARPVTYAGTVVKHKILFVFDRKEIEVGTTDGAEQPIALLKTLSEGLFK